MTDGLSDRARSLIDAAKYQGGPSPAQQAKMAAAVVAATTSTAAAFGAGTAGSVASTTSVTKLLGAGVVAALLGVGGTMAVTKAVAPAARPRAQSVVAEPSTTRRGVPPPPARRDARVGAAREAQAVLPPTEARVGAGGELEAATAAASRAPEHSGAPAMAPDTPETGGPGVTPPRRIGEGATPASKTDGPTATAPRRAGEPVTSAAKTTGATGTDSKGAARVRPSATARSDGESGAGDATSGETPAAAPASRTSLSDSTAAEVAALASAMEALDSKDFTQALTLARTTRRAHPAGALRPELTLLEVEALCGLLRIDEAQDVADTMPQVDRTALVLTRLRRTCVSLK